MATRTNEFGQPIGEPVVGWNARPYPNGDTIEGRYCRLERLNLRHLDGLYAVISEDDASVWTYMPFGPFENKESLRSWLDAASTQTDPFFYAIVDAATSAIKGFASYLRIAPDVGVIEVGAIYFSKALRRSAIATEAMYLMARHAIDDLGYRRYEWKCDSLNQPSRSAAQRLGFTFEGIFRQAIVYKGRNRDTAWFAIIDHDWPNIKRAMERWLDPGNFSARGTQKVRLEELRANA
jgi:RimJ/RimL family protein N-acetyltransferase